MTDAQTSWICPSCKQAVWTPFCPQCGERPLKPNDLALRSLFGKLGHAMTSLDGRLVRTFWRLLRRPGALTVAYMTGNRKPYVAPFQLFLVANVLFFAVQSVTSTNIFGSTLESHLYHQDWSVLAQSLVAQHLEMAHISLEQYAPRFDQAVVLYAKTLIILMTIPFALMMSLLFLGSRKPFMAHVVLSLHVYTVLLLAFSLALLATTLLVWFGGPGLNSPTVDNVVTVINLAALGWYIYLATGPVFEAFGRMRVVKAVVLALTAGGLVLGYRFLLLLITLYAR